MRHPDDHAPTERPEQPRAPGALPLEPLDPELLALPPPPQAQRVVALTIMAAAVLAVVALLVSLESDIRYALSSGPPIDLAQAARVAPSTLVSNSYVRVSGTPTIGRSIGFGRGFGTRYRVFPLRGQPDIYVQAREEGGESFVRSEYSGRLVTLEALGGRYAEIARVMQREASLPVTGESFLLLADEPPATYVWTLFVALICLGFVLLDLYFIVRWFRPVKWAAVPAEKAA